MFVAHEIFSKRLAEIPRCPSCKRKKFVGQVQSVIEKRYKKGKGRTFNCCKAYYCSECLVEWGEDGSIREPLYA